MAKKAYIGVGGVAKRVLTGYSGAYFGGYAGHPECIVSSADSLLYTYGTRNYKKAYAGDAYACTVVVGGWLSPLLVSKTPDAVARYTDGDYSSGISGYQLTVAYQGETWYVSSEGAAFEATAPTTTNVIHLNTVLGRSFTDRAEAALAFLKYALPVPPADNIAHRIKKAYVGVGGVARPCWNSGSLAYYGTAAALSSSRRYLEAATIGGYAILGGGGRGDGNNPTQVDTYDENLTHGAAPSFSSKHFAFGSASNSKYAFFAGGGTQTWGSPTSVTEAYDASLTHTNPTGLSFAGYYMSGCSLREHAVFDCGRNNSTISYVINAYSTDLTRVVPAGLPSADKYACGVTGNRALFLNASNTVVYDDDLVQTELPQCGVTAGMGSASTSSYLVCVRQSVGVAYNRNLTCIPITGIEQSGAENVGGAVDEFALFAVGYNTAVSSVVNAYDGNLIRFTPGHGLSQARGDSEPAQIGNYLLFAGGFTNLSNADNSTTAVVDVYTVV